MSFGIDALRGLVARHGDVARIVVTHVRGSAPRGVGTSMVVFEGGQVGTIGGGALEFQMSEAARAMIREGVARRDVSIALGPALGQCCGGAVRLLIERFDAATLPEEGAVFARPVAGAAEMPLSVRRRLAEMRNGTGDPAPALIDGWFIEPMQTARTPIWIYGAGHVGRAIVAMLAPLPDLDITWVDTAADRFPDDIPDGVRPVIVPAPQNAVQLAPENARHVILTYSHEMDLALCHAVLCHRFAFAGVIGSATKWARFRSRLAALGHRPEVIDTLTCPIGDPNLGKHPQAIAVGVVAQLLSASDTSHQRREIRA